MNHPLSYNAFDACNDESIYKTTAVSTLNKAAVS